jgi:hypothetical protein
MSDKKKDKPKKYSDAGKGDKSRVDNLNKYAENWEKIFRPKKEKYDSDPMDWWMDV